MARRIVWSKRSQEDRKNIFSYWNARNESNHYSLKLNRLFIDAVEILSIHPQLGRKSTKNGIKIMVVRDYLILYEFNEKELRILTIFDSRQHPDKLKKRLMKWVRAITMCSSESLLIASDSAIAANRCMQWSERLRIHAFKIIVSIMIHKAHFYKCQI